VEDPIHLHRVAKHLLETLEKTSMDIQTLRGPPGRHHSSAGCACQHKSRPFLRELPSGPFGTTALSTSKPPAIAAAPVPMAPPEPNNLAEQGISSMYLTNSHLVLGAQEATAAYQIIDTYLQIAQVTVGILATIIGIVQIIVMYSTANSK